MARIDGVPIKLGGVDIGAAHISDDGILGISILTSSDPVKELFSHIRDGFVFGLSISPIVNPAVDGNLITRIDHEQPLPKIGEANA